jgi:hypothetical protein
MGQVSRLGSFICKKLGLVGNLMPSVVVESLTMIVGR